MAPSSGEPAGPGRGRAAAFAPPAPATGKAAGADGEQDVPSAIERLALSRERLRDAMLPSTRKRPAGEHAVSDGLGTLAAGLMHRLRAIPGVTVLLEAIEDWWARHPLHSAGLVAAEASRRIAAPIAERRPLTLLLGAVLVGALLALLKPWRWLLRPALFAGLLPALLARGVRELPLEHWLQIAAALTSPREASRSAAAEASPAAAYRPSDMAAPAMPSPTHATATPSAVVREEPSAVYP
jgi:hypothetical protein